ncbi:MAG: ribosome silencing factor [Chloroflexota bacterium]
MTEELTPRALAEQLLAVAEDKKAWEPLLIDVRGQTTVAEYFVICEGDTDRQVRAIADAMLEKLREQGVRPLRVGGYEDASWVLLDFDSVLAHVFLPGERAYYDLEGLWAAAAKGRKPKAM